MLHFPPSNSRPVENWVFYHFSGLWRPCHGQSVSYALTPTALDWSGAAQACSRLGDGARLATPRNSAQNACVHRRGKTNIGGTVWIGVYAESWDLTNYKYVDGRPLVYSDWIPGEPSGAAMQRCVTVTRAWWLQNQLTGWDNDGCEKAVSSSLRE